jgi:hypothetical protein
MFNFSNFLFEFAKIKICERNKTDEMNKIERNISLALFISMHSVYNCRILNTTDISILSVEYRLILPLYRYIFVQN